MVRLILALFFALCVAIFAVINVNPAPVHYIFGVTQLPLVLIILGSACFGGLIVGLLGAVSVFRLRRERKRLQLTIANLESRIPSEEEQQQETVQNRTIYEEPERAPAPPAPATDEEEPSESSRTVPEP